MNDLRGLNERRCPAEITLATGEVGRCHKPWGHELGSVWASRTRSQHTAVVVIENRSHPVTWFVTPRGVAVDVTVERPVSDAGSTRVETHRRSWLRGRELDR